jgi:hypothetical protein
VFVLGKNRERLMLCRPARARLLIRRKRAVIYRLCPFVIKLKDREAGDTSRLNSNSFPAPARPGSRSSVRNTTKPSKFYSLLNSYTASTESGTRSPSVTTSAARAGIARPDTGRSGF